MMPCFWFVINKATIKVVICNIAKVLINESIICNLDTYYSIAFHFYTFPRSKQKNAQLIYSVFKQLWRKTEQ